MPILVGGVELIGALPESGGGEKAYLSVSLPQSSRDGAGRSCLLHQGGVRIPRDGWKGLHRCTRRGPRGLVYFPKALLLLPREENNTNSNSTPSLYTVLFVLLKRLGFKTSEER